MSPCGWSWTAEVRLGAPTSLSWGTQATHISCLRLVEIAVSRTSPPAGRLIHRQLQTHATLQTYPPLSKGCCFHLIPLNGCPFQPEVPWENGFFNVLGVLLYLHLPAVGNKGPPIHSLGRGFQGALFSWGCVSRNRCSTTNLLPPSRGTIVFLGYPQCGSRSTGAQTEAR
ncbi:hypothetical protein B484DRAFT_171791 [Ochromonadaceae sp. CCMP2298]|nr:hypothetical protein B484DRAFT_171791 [Ochromonadaceae sp. CCMP2298]